MDDRDEGRTFGDRFLTVDFIICATVAISGGSMGEAAPGTEIEASAPATSVKPVSSSLQSSFSSRRTVLFASFAEDPRRDEPREGAGELSLDLFPDRIIQPKRRNPGPAYQILVI